MDVTKNTERTAQELPRWLGWLTLLLNLIALGLIAFGLYKLWGSELNVLAKLLLTPLTIIAVGSAYNMFIGLPLAVFVQRQLER